MKKMQTRMDSRDGGNAQTRKLLPEFEKTQRNDSIDNGSAIKIDLEDHVQEEIDYRNSFLICYVLGANPPFPLWMSS